MRTVIFTGNSLRHKYIANTLCEKASSALVVSECQPHDTGQYDDESSMIVEHFARFREVEKEFFREDAAFNAPTLPVLYKEVNLPIVYEAVKKFNPEAAFVYGSWLIKDPLLSLIPTGKFVNLHLGLSPYYRGSGTNFWPLVNNEPEYIGATLLHIDAGVDTGNIVAHARPNIAPDDTAHTIGCKAIVAGGKVLEKAFEILKSGGDLPRVAQWAHPGEKVYRRKDFNDAAIKKYHENIEKGMIRRYVQKGGKEIKLVELQNVKRKTKNAKQLYNF